VEGDPVLSKDIRFLFAPNDAKLEGGNETDNQKNFDVIKKMLQVSPGSTVLLRGHVDNSKVEEFRKTGGEAYVRTMALRSVELSKNRASSNMAWTRTAWISWGAAGRSRSARTRSKIGAWKCNGSCSNNMTVNDLIKLASGHLLALVLFFVAPPVIAWICGAIHGRGNGGNAPWKYVYSVLVYLVCIPGLLASVLTGYQLFFQRGDLLNVNIAVYFLPILSMIVTLIFIHKTVNFENVPGFDRISGLMVMIGCSFVIALAIDKTRIWLMFHGSIAMLFALAAGIFALLKWGTYMLFRRRDEPKQPAPKFPGVQ
jgi:hypothetical protein